MKAYLMCFIITIICTYIAQCEFKKKNKKSGIFFSLLAILIPSILAGLRSLNVGMDMDIYVKELLKYSTNHSIKEVIGFSAKMDIEVGYSIFVYVIANIFGNNVNLLLFLIQLLSSTFIYLFAYKERDYISMWIVMLIFLLTLYMDSYAIMRQSIAISIILYGTTLVNQKSKVKLILLTLLAVSFHSSAVVGIIMYTIIYVFNNNFKINFKNKFFKIFIISLIIISFFYKDIVYIFTYNLKILPYRFYWYICNYTYNQLSIPYTEVLFKLPIFFLAILIFKKVKKKDSKYLSYFIFLFVDIIILILSFKVKNISRISYYFFYAGIFVTISKVHILVKKDKFNIGICNLFIIVYLSIFWIWRYIIQGWYYVYPYTSDILKILN